MNPGTESQELRHPVVIDQVNQRTALLSYTKLLMSYFIGLAWRISTLFLAGPR
jgi:hypothetical protein